MTKSKPIPIILLAINLAFVFICILTLSILQTNTKPNLPLPDKIKIYNKSTSATKTLTQNSNQTEYNSIIELYNAMFEKTYVKQILDNDLFIGKTEEDITKPVWSDYYKINGIYLEFCYSTPKRFIIYREQNSRQIFIDSIIFKLSNNNSTQPIEIYYSINQNYETTEPAYPICAEANSYKLYKFTKEYLTEEL